MIGRAVSEPAALCLAHTGRALQQSRVQIEDVAGIGFASGRAAQQQRHLTVRPGVLAQVVVDDECISAILHEIFAHSATREGREVLQSRRLRRRSRNHDSVLHSAVLVERVHNLRDLRGLLADGDVDAEQVLALLIDDGVDGDGALACLAVADDKLALASPDRDHGVDRFDARLHGRVDVLA